MTNRISIVIRGAVQGVGFRPFVYRLATEMGLPGWVLNSSDGVFIEVEGSKARLDEFIIRLQKESPPHAFIQSLEFSHLDPVGYKIFEIKRSDSTGEKTALVMPDIATCTDCLKEIFDPANRRYLYPFTNCTNCGPRFSIIKTLPYDRVNTSMSVFQMCPECQAEYEDPSDRRFHAQPNACPVCGPKLELWDADGVKIAEAHEAMISAVNAIREGKIVAIKGLGGFHLVADARNETAVKLLRERKHREEKPFALMFPSLESIKKECEVNFLEERLLTSPESPIVLLNRRFATDIDPLKLAERIENFSIFKNPDSEIAPSVAPNNPYFGIMLPYTPLHHILMRELGFPIVATSGNISDEPICIDEREALIRLHGIGDFFLVHNRPIVRHVDDSIVRIIFGRELVIRRARGYAPLPVQIKSKTGSSILAVGAHLKNTVALKLKTNVFISQHIGDLETTEAYNAFRRVISDFQTLYEAKPDSIACDLHPDYLSTQYARISRKQMYEIQHHYAHVASCMAENQIEGDLLGVSWDGTGLGIDRTIWGGEFLVTTADSFKRVASFKQFPLPGGEKAIKEPRRSGLGLLFALLGESSFTQMDIETIKAFTKSEINLIQQMLKSSTNCPLTSSAGRLFDAIASLTGLRQHISFEGQAAMELEYLTAQSNTNDTYSFSVDGINVKAKQEIKTSELPQNIETESAKDNKESVEDILVIDWSPMIKEILNDVRHQIPAYNISRKFHNTLTEIIITVAKHVGLPRIVLTGGCFQNKYLTERTVRRLIEEGLKPYWHQRVPPNDGGISLGQIYAVIRKNNSS